MTRQRYDAKPKGSSVEVANKPSVREASESRNQFQIVLHSLRGKFKGKDLLKALEAEKKKAQMK